MTKSRQNDECRPSLLTKIATLFIQDRVMQHAAIITYRYHFKLTIDF